MQIRGRAYRGDRSDDRRIAELVGTQPDRARHVVDLAWRLSSPAAQSGANAYLWQDPAGRAVGFVAWQPNWAALDFYVRPGRCRRAVEAAVFGWAERRYAELDAERGEPLPYWVEYRDDDEDRRRLGTGYGYRLREQRYLQFTRELREPLAEPAVPAGFAVRSLAGASEAEEYALLHRAAFGTEAMTARWRARTLLMPQYRQALDLVAVAPDRTLAGFCVGWLDATRRLGQIEPVGVHPRYQGRGLGRALLAEILRRFAGSGAERVIVETDSPAARRAYESVGFRAGHPIHALGRYAGE